MVIHNKYHKIGLIIKAIQGHSTIENACTVAGISRDTFRRWCKDYPKIKAYVNELTDNRNIERVDVVEDKLYLSAVGGFITEKSKTYYKDGQLKEECERYAPPNVASMIFFLTNKAPDKWKNNRDRFPKDQDDLFKEDLELIPKLGEESKNRVTKFLHT